MTLLGYDTLITEKDEYSKKNFVKFLKRKRLVKTVFTFGLLEIM